MNKLMMLALVAITSGCTHGWNSNVSETPPHDQLVGTTWMLKTNAYIIEYQDQQGNYIIIPCDKSYGAYVNYTIMGNPYNEENIGKKFDGVKIVGGLRAGEVLKITLVLKNTHIEMGTNYIPMMIPKQSNKWTGKEELNGNKLYRRYYDQGILNPTYAERVEEDAEPSAQDTTGSGGDSE